MKPGKFCRGAKGEDFSARIRSLEMIETIQFLSYSMSQKQSDDISKSLLYILRDESAELDKSLSQRDRLPLLLATLAKSVINSTNIVHLRPSQVEVM